METVVATTLVGVLWGFAVANPVAAVAGLGLVAFSGYTLGSALFSTSQPAPATFRPSTLNACTWGGGESKVKLLAPRIARLLRGPLRLVVGHYPFTVGTRVRSS